MPNKNAKLKISVYLGIVILSILAFEFLGQVSFYILNGRFLFEQEEAYKLNNMIFENHPYLVGRPKSNVKVEHENIAISSTSYHTRFTSAEGILEDKLKVAILGGSTTFGVKISDHESWPYILQQKLGPGYYVINLGVPGYSTIEAIIQMSLLVPEFKPDIIIHYHGWNDIRNYHDSTFSSDYYSHGMMQKRNLGLEKSSIVNKFFFVFLAKKINTFIFSESPTEINFNEKPDSVVDAIFTRNLQTLELLSENLSERVFFVPQILNSAKFENSDSSNKWSPYIKNSIMPAFINHFNTITENVTSDYPNKSIFVKDVLYQDWQRDDFIDFGHFSAKGGNKFAEILKERILNE